MIVPATKVGGYFVRKIPILVIISVCTRLQVTNKTTTRHSPYHSIKTIAGECKRYEQDESARVCCFVGDRDRFECPADRQKLQKRQKKQQQKTATKYAALRKHANILMYWKSHHQTPKFSNKTLIFFHISAQNIDCEYSVETPCRGGSNEYLQSVFWAEIKKTL